MALVADGRHHRRPARRLHKGRIRRRNARSARERARKIARKGLDLIVANDVSAAGAGFGTDTNLVTLIGADGTCEELPLLTKYDVGHRILDRVAHLLAARG